MLQTSFCALIFWLLLLPCLWSCGSLAGFKEDNSSLSGILKIVLGLAVFAYFLIFMSMWGALKPSAVLIFILFFLIIRWEKGKEVFNWLKDGFNFFWSDRSIFGRICQFSLLITLFFTAILCFLPEISNDALGIHLYLAKRFMIKASLAPFFYDIISYRPLLMSVLYASGLFLQNVAISKLFHWFSGGLLVSAAAIKIYEATQNKKMTLFLSLMLWLTPTLMNQVTTTYIDAGASLFIFVGYCVFQEAYENWKPKPFFYAGLFIGVAVAIRYLSLNAYFAMIILLGLKFFQYGFKVRAVLAAFYLSLGVALTSAYWFLRAWIATGNPVYPYLGPLFGTENFEFLDSLYFHYMGLPKSMTSFLMLTWNVTFKPQYFDYHHWVGPFYLIVLPFFLYTAIKINKARTHVLFVFFSVVFWYFTGQNVRYLLPTMPVYLIAAAIGMNDSSKQLLQNGLWQMLTKTAACAMIAFLLLLTAYHFRYQFMPLFGIWSMQEYLQKMERSVPIADWVNKNLPQKAKILSIGEPHLFYFDREAIMDVDFNIRTHYKNQNSPSAIALLLMENGITHILDAREIRNLNLSENTLRPIDLLLNDKNYTEAVVSITSLNVLDRKHQYVLYKLSPLQKE